MDSELFNGAFEPFFNYKKNRYIVSQGDITRRFEYDTSTPAYRMSNEKLHLDKQIFLVFH